MRMLALSSLPAVNASLNAACTFFILLGYAMIRRRQILAHRICMLIAFVCSVAFLVFYVYFHIHAGIVRFSGQGWIRPVYSTLLVSHTILAVATLPLVLVALSLALSDRFKSHRRIAQWALPVWLYVSVTGVVIYWLLYIVYAPIGAPAL